MTTFAMGLNAKQVGETRQRLDKDWSLPLGLRLELLLPVMVLHVQDNVCPTDSRLRPDQRFLEDGTAFVACQLYPCGSLCTRLQATLTSRRPRSVDWKKSSELPARLERRLA